MKARRIRRGPLSLRYVSSAGDDRARVGYAVGRSAGPAVRRNRIRRRLRACVHRAEQAGRVPPGAYLLGAGPETLRMPFGALEETLGELFDAAREGRR
jgi:ribonuclease P protein component